MTIPKYLGTYFNNEDERNNPTMPPFSLPPLPPPTTSHTCNQISCLSVPSHARSVRPLRWSSHSSLEANSDVYGLRCTVLGHLT